MTLASSLQLDDVRTLGALSLIAASIMRLQTTAAISNRVVWSKALLHHIQQMTALGVFISVVN
ncbi:MAG: hypothetical protein HC800_08950 [Phormidesmis sp. RL_2_1]|nr:hypothetical protein [Phormidesmis sp. RL_2_1]